MGDHRRTLSFGVIVNADACGYEEASALVPRTQRVRLFTDVADLPLRPADMLAKATTSLAFISGGRFELGIGAGLKQGHKVKPPASGSHSIICAGCEEGESSSGGHMNRVRCRRSEEHTSELQSRQYLVCRLLLDKKK